MRRLPFISALVTAVAGLFSRAPKRRTVDMGQLAPSLKPPKSSRRRGPRGFSRRNKVARGRIAGTASFARWLRAKFAKNALARYGLDVIGPDGRPDKDNRRAMRNARKQERQQARERQERHAP